MGYPNYLSNSWQAKQLCDQFISAKPFPHVVIDEFLDKELAAKIATEFPNMDDQLWFEYNIQSRKN